MVLTGEVPLATYGQKRPCRLLNILQGKEGTTAMKYPVQTVNSTTREEPNVEL